MKSPTGVGGGGMVNHLQKPTQAKVPTPVADSGGLVLKFAMLTTACCPELGNFLLLQAWLTESDMDQTTECLWLPVSRWRCCGKHGRSQL